MEKVGIFGGTFDPIHTGHLIVAEEVRIKLGLSVVNFVPAGQPWLKEKTRKITDGNHRLEMIKLATVSNPHFKVLTLELEMPGPSYSVDTLLTLKKEFPEADFYFILGIDALLELHLWKDPRRLIQLCHLVALKRPRIPENVDLKSLEVAIPEISSRIVVVDNSQVGISSSEIRRRAAQGLSIHYLVPQPVEDYIVEHKLYKGCDSY